MDSQRDGIGRHVRTGQFTKRNWHVIIISLACLALVQGSAAFAIKYHFDLTENAMRIEGFTGDPIGLVQTFNWMDDLAEQSKGDEFKQKAVKYIVYRGSPEMMDGSDDHMHFDDLKNYDEVKAEWMRLENQTYVAVKEAEQNHDTEGLLAIMGLSLHTVQDFYSHSNWVERDFGGDATWYDIPEWEKQEGLIGIYTKSQTRGHGEINKDYSTRPDFYPAYRDGFYASVQWIELIRSWVNPDFWEEAQQHNCKGRRYADSVMRGNWYGGTWNSQTAIGNGGWQEFKNYLSTAVVGIFSNVPGDTYRTWDRYGRIVTGPDTYQWHPQEYEYIPPYKWLRIVTQRIDQTDRDGWDIDPGGKADFRTKVGANGQYYYEDPITDDDHVTPAGWHTLVPLADDTTDVSIRYEVWDDDQGAINLYRGMDDQCDINPEYDEQIWTYIGPLDGVKDRQVVTDGYRGCTKYGSCKIKCWGCFHTKGDGDEAKAEFYISIETPRRASTYVRTPTPPPNSPPSADFTLSTMSGRPPFPLVITDASTGDPTSWSWTFSGPIDAGPGPITSKTLPKYTLTQPGEVQITLTVSNAYGSSSKTRTVTVTGSAPVADFYLGPAFGTEPLDVTLYDMSIGIPATWEWTIESPGQAPQKVYTKEIPNLDQLAAGTYRVTLTVANAYGSSSRTRTVTVLPAVQPAEPLSGPTEVTFKCSAGCTCTDPDLPGVTRCSDTPCGADGVKYFYCTKPKPLVTCSGACQCLLESEGIQTFGNPTHVPQRCSSDPCETAGGISKYCYHQGAVTCPAGYQCLSPRAAGWTFRRPVQYSGTVCGYAVDPDTPSVRDPEYCYREG